MSRGSSRRLTSTIISTGALLIVGGCSSRPARPSPADASDAPAADHLDLACQPDVSGQAGDSCVSTRVDLPPVPMLRFQMGPPRDAEDYPYSATNLPTDGPPPRAPVFLTSTGSADPEGDVVSVFWNVRDPSGSYLPIIPAADAAQVSFSPTVTGPHIVTLEVTESSGLRQTGQVSVTLDVRPIPCADDGVSGPCAESLLVEGGTFTAGSPDGMGFDNEKPTHPATVASFMLDKYEVTVGRFRKFLADSGGVPPAPGAGAHPLISDSGWQSKWNTSLPASLDAFDIALSECGGTWTNDVGPSEARPITCVTWFDAFAFCVWDGKRLPTEAEWEYAAAGGDRQWIYPWGNDAPSVDLAVFGCLFDGRPNSCADADLPVAGSTVGGTGRWGQLDLAGSVWEWTLDAYGLYTVEPCIDCANVVDTFDPNADGGTGSDNTPRIFRGGDYKFDDPTSLRAASRYAFDGSYPDQTRGFRCASSPPGVAAATPLP
jgi:formylglycine-generating enzyme required for sulfatase activity